jgi:hypothetical protein
MMMMMMALVVLHDDADAEGRQQLVEMKMMAAVKTVQCLRTADSR